MEPFVEPRALLGGQPLNQAAWAQARCALNGGLHVCKLMLNAWRAPDSHFARHAARAARAEGFCDSRQDSRQADAPHKGVHTSQLPPSPPSHRLTCSFLQLVLFVPLSQQSNGHTGGSAAAVAHPALRVGPALPVHCGCGSCRKKPINTQPVIALRRVSRAVPAAA